MPQNDKAIANLTWKVIAAWLIGCGAILFAAGIADGVAKHGVCLSHCTTVLKPDDQ
jgi:hypothetical protein